MINILDESINITDITDGIYVDPHYIPYLEEYLKYVDSNDKIVASYEYVTSIQIGKIPRIYNKKAIPHIRNWIPDWFHPCDNPLVDTPCDYNDSIYCDLFGLPKPLVAIHSYEYYRYFINGTHVNEILAELTQYPKKQTIYPSVAISSELIGLLEVFDDYYTVTSSVLPPFQVAHYYSNKFGNPTIYKNFDDPSSIVDITINDKIVEVWKFPLNINK